MDDPPRGWVEFRRRDWPADPDAADGWRALCNLGDLLEPSGPFLGSVFGLDRTVGFEPVGPDRGFPDAVSRVASLDRDLLPPGEASWVTKAELDDVDWHEQADLTAITAREDWHVAVRRTEQFDEQGTVLESNVDAWTTLPPDQVSTLAAEGELVYDGYGYRVHPAQRRELAPRGWPLLWSWLETLEDRWELDPENLRFVVWKPD